MTQYLKLLMFREGKEVLGKNGYNLWLLTLVLVATFTSIAFSEGSSIYLKDKMVDPFTNWVTIKKTKKADKFNKFKKELESQENKSAYGYTNVQLDQTNNWNMDGVNDGLHTHYLSLRSFEDMQSNIVKAILDDNNIVSDAKIDSTYLTNETLGIILSLEAAQFLGFSQEHLPSYIYHLASTDGADTLGVQIIEDEFVRIPLPVIAVAKRLPDNVDMVVGRYLYSQRENNSSTYPFNFSKNEYYLHELHYFVADEVGLNAFQASIEKYVPDSLKQSFKIAEDKDCDYLRPWRKGQMYKVAFNTEIDSREIFQSIADRIEKSFDSELVSRVFNYNCDECDYKEGTYISIEFSDQSHIRDFEKFAGEYDITLEMSKVASMENFNAVTVMAGILSAAMVIFAIVCIIMFLVNMLQSYFQKVRRNIGTFKAFGMNATELIYVYVIILVLIVSVAVVMALLITYGIQLFLPIIGIEKEGFNFLSLWNTTTYIAAAVVFISTILTVCVVMVRMLSQTPGDLIYDRN